MQQQLNLQAKHQIKKVPFALLFSLVEYQWLWTCLHPTESFEGWWTAKDVTTWLLPVNLQTLLGHWTPTRHTRPIYIFFWRLHTKTGQIDTKTYKTYNFLETSCQSRTDRVFCWFRVATQDVLCFNFATPRENVNKHHLLVSLFWKDNIPNSWISDNHSQWGSE